MSEELKRLLDKARRSIRAAQRLYKNKDYDFSISRAYYAMFYCAEGLLLTLEKSFSKHSTVIAAFGFHFVKTKRMPPRFHSYLLSAFKDRQVGDYEFIRDLTQEEAEVHLKNAKEFLNQTIIYLKEQSKHS